MNGSYFIVETSKFLLIDATAVTLGQGHGKVIQYISPDPYILCAKYLRFSSNTFDVRGKSCCGSEHGRGGNELKSPQTGVTKWVRYHYSCDRVTTVWSLWRHQQSIVKSSTERKPSEWDTPGEDLKRLSFLSSFMDSLCRERNKIMYILSWWNVSALIQVLFWCLFPSLLRNSGNKHQNNPLKQFDTRVHIFFSIKLHYHTVLHMEWT